MRRGAVEGWGGSRNDCRGGCNSRAGRMMTPENTGLRKQALGQQEAQHTRGRPRGQCFCEHFLGVSGTRQCGLFWFKLWSPRGLQSAGEVGVEHIFIIHQNKF